MHRILTPEITQAQRTITDELPMHGVITVWLVQNTPPQVPGRFTPGKLYIARRTREGRALRVFDNHHNERFIQLGEPCPFHIHDTALRDSGMVSYWIADHVECVR